MQKLLDNGPIQPLLPELVLTDIKVNHNGNSDLDLYSDKEDGKNRDGHLYLSLPVSLT